MSKKLCEIGTLPLLASMNRICSLVAVKFLLPFVLFLSLLRDLDRLDLLELSDTEDFFDFRDLETDLDNCSPDSVEACRICRWIDDLDC